MRLRTPRSTGRPPRGLVGSDATSAIARQLHGEQVVLLERIRAGLAATTEARGALEKRTQVLREALACLGGVAQGIADGGPLAEAQAMRTREVALATELATTIQRVAVLAETQQRLRDAEERLTAQLTPSEAQVAGENTASSAVAMAQDDANTDDPPGNRSPLNAAIVPGDSALTQHDVVARPVNPSTVGRHGTASAPVPARHDGRDGQHAPFPPHGQPARRPGLRIRVGWLLGIVLVALGLAAVSLVLFRPLGGTGATAPAGNPGDTLGVATAPTTATLVIANPPATLPLNPTTAATSPALSPAAGEPSASATSTASPTVAPPVAVVRQRVAAAEAGLRSGQFEATVDYGNGSRSSATLRFDLGDAQRPSRFHFTTTSQGATGPRTVEQIVIGEQAWQRQPDGRWVRASTHDGIAEQLQVYLPGIATVTMPITAETSPVMVLHWHDAKLNANVSLQVDAITGAPQTLRQVTSAGTAVLVVTYRGWNTAVDIVAPVVP